MCNSTGNFDSVASLVASLRNRVAELEDRLDAQTKWGEMISKRYQLFCAAYNAAELIQQQDSPRPRYGIVP